MNTSAAHIEKYQEPSLLRRVAIATLAAVLAVSAVGAGTALAAPASEAPLERSVEEASHVEWLIDAGGQAIIDEFGLEFVHQIGRGLHPR